MPATPAFYNLLYPHVVSVRRNTEQPTAGQNAYDGAQASAEVVILPNQVANIQIDRTGRSPDAKLPDDMSSLWTYKVMLPGQWLGGPGYGVIFPNDILVDGLGQRYQVLAVEHQPIGCQIRAQRMET